MNSTPNLVELEDLLHLVIQPTGVPIYDFAPEAFFRCRHLWQVDTPITAVARMGAAQDYAERFQRFQAMGITLIHDPETYELTSMLPCWYPHLTKLTPRSMCFDQLPSSADIEDHFDWPVFVKGERQTNRHTRRQSIIENAQHFDELMREWQQEPILAWQKLVCREFIPLRSVATPSQSGMPKSFEFRSFWWRGSCVGVGRYWISESYSMTESEMEALLRVGKEVVQRISATFLVIDIAQTEEGDWIVIELNDGQDSGYAGNNPFTLWQRVIELERNAMQGGSSQQAESPS